MQEIAAVEEFAMQQPFRSPHAAIERIVELEERPIRYDDVGQGPPIVFVHGVWATAGLWEPVTDKLAARFRCISLTLPLGVHKYPSPKNVDHSPAALARVIAGLLEALDLHDVTLVGNDTGGALCQLVVVNHPERVGRLVLTNCDAFEVFPPKSLQSLYALAKIPVLWGFVAQVFRLKGFQRRFFKTVAHSEPSDPANLAMLMNRFANDPAIREDLRLTVAEIHPQVTMDAAKHFHEFSRAVLVLWGTEDRFFPVSLGKRLAAAFPNARLQLIEKSKLFVSLDAPSEVATAIDAFATIPEHAAP